MSTEPEESRRLLWGQALTFLGPMIAVGGALAILRTHQPSVFFSLLMPLGLVLLGVGYWLRWTAERPQRPDRQAGNDIQHKSSDTSD